MIVSEKGWVRCRNNHGVDPANLALKDGDRLAAAFECRSVDALAAPTDGGWALTVAVSTLPDWRGNGLAAGLLVELPSSAKIAHARRQGRSPGAAGHQRRLRLPPATWAT